MSATKRVQQWATFARTWHLFDCKWQDPYDSAHVIKKYLMGAHKPIYHPMNDCGDVVVAINSREIALRGSDWRQRAYFHHTGYPGGASWTLAWELHNKDPTMVQTENKSEEKDFEGIKIHEPAITQGLSSYWPPIDIIRKAVYRALKGNLQRRHTMERLLIFPKEHVPEDIMQNVTSQIRQLRGVPTRLDHIPKEEVENYPKVMEFPEEYVLK